MTIPADATKVNFDASGDDPRAARSELVTWVDGYNTFLAHARASPLFANSYTVGEGVEINAAALRVKIRASWGIGRDGNGLALDVNGLATIAADVDPAADFLPVWDASGGVISKVIPSNLLKAYKDLTELTSVDAAADKIPVYDASAAALKWMKPSSLSGLAFAGEVDQPTGVAAMQVTPLSNDARHLIILGHIVPVTNSQTISLRLLRTDGTPVAAVTTAAGVDNTQGVRFFAFATQVQAAYNKSVQWLANHAGGTDIGIANQGSDTSAVDQIQVLASSGNVVGNLQVYYAR